MQEHRRFWMFCMAIFLCLNMSGEIFAAGVQVSNDWDGDGKTDVTVFRSNFPWAGATSFFVEPSSGLDLRLLSPNAGWIATGSGFYRQWGLNGDTPVTGDYSGDGFVDFAVYRNGTWYISYQIGGTATIQWGLPGDIPVEGDYEFTNGDGRFDACVYRPSNKRIYVRYSSGGTANWATPNPSGLGSYRVPIPAPFTNGRMILMYGGPGNLSQGWNTFDTPAGPGNGNWGTQSTNFNLGSDYLVTGGHPHGPGVGRTSVTWWRPSNGTWYDAFHGAIAQWGLSGDIPVSGDFDGDNYRDFCVWRQNFPFAGQATFFVKTSSGANPGGWTSTSGGYYRSWGINGDTPLNAGF